MHFSHLHSKSCKNCMLLNPLVYVMCYVVFVLRVVNQKSLLSVYLRYMRYPCIICCSAYRFTPLRFVLSVSQLFSLKNFINYIGIEDCLILYIIIFNIISGVKASWKMALFSSISSLSNLLEWMNRTFSKRC